MVRLENDIPPFSSYEKVKTKISPGITKHLDAQELNCLVRFKTGVTDSDRVGK